MTDFMLTLPSDSSSSSFPTNKPNRYKVKLPHQIYLPHDDWEVALYTISLPATQTVLDKKYLGDFPVIYHIATNNPPRLDNKEFYVKDEDLTNAHIPVKTGLSFWKKIVQALRNDFYRELKGGDRWGNVDNFHSLADFKWEKRGDEWDLHIINSDLPGKSRANYLDINLELAQAFGLVVKNTDDKGATYWTLGPSIEIKHTEGPVLPKPSDSGITGFWRVYENSTKTLPAPAGRVTNYSALRLYSFNDWYITDINGNFQRAFGNENKTLFVYADVAHTQIVGESMTDMIKEIVYINKFKGPTQFEPIHLHFIPIRKNVFDTVEVAITEVDGKLADLTGGSTILTLLFQRKSQPRSR